VVTEDGEPRFVAADVCAVLGLGRQQDSTRHLDEDEKGECLVDTPSGRQMMVVVTEAGLYSLILRSRRPEAKACKRWITHEELPRIRRTGRYRTRELDLGCTDDVALVGAAGTKALERARAAEAKVAELVAPAAARDHLASSQGD